MMTQPITLFGTPNIASPRQCTVATTTDRPLVDMLVKRWHSTHPYTPLIHKVAFLVYAPNLEPLAVATWSNPIAKNEDQESTLELTRYAIGPVAPRNLGTYALARMREWIRENMPEINRLISYQNADVHDGALYKADNWNMVYDRYGERPWSQCRPTRTAIEVQHKIKWEREP